MIPGQGGKALPQQRGTRWNAFKIQYMHVWMATQQGHHLQTY